MKNEKEKFEKVSDEVSLEDIFGLTDNEDGDEPWDACFLFGEEDEEDDFSCVLTTNQLFSERAAENDFSKVTRVLSGPEERQPKSPEPDLAHRFKTQNPGTSRWSQV